jgi:hypothetical protein
VDVVVEVDDNGDGDGDVSLRRHPGDLDLNWVSTFDARRRPDSDSGSSPFQGEVG